MVVPYFLLFFKIFLLDHLMKSKDCASVVIWLFCESEYENPCLSVADEHFVGMNFDALWPVLAKWTSKHISSSGWNRYFCLS